MSQPPVADPESVSKPPLSGWRLAVGVLTVVAVGLGLTLGVIAVFPSFRPSRSSDCGIDRGGCVSEFRLSRLDGKLPTEQQFREELPSYARLLMAWKLSEARSFQPVTLPSAFQFWDFMVFVGCTGGGKLKVTVTDESTTGSSWISVPCDGVIPVGMAIAVGHDQTHGPFTFEMTPEGNVTDAEFFVRD
ncbi:hypothetical protein [Rhizocola hellebori]|nr:hypothetical protein [Rhizocola hellebori]